MSSAPKHYQVVLSEDDMTKVRNIAKVGNNKDALFEAVQYYIVSAGGVQ